MLEIWILDAVHRAKHCVGRAKNRQYNRREAGTVI